MEDWTHNLYEMLGVSRVKQPLFSCCLQAYSEINTSGSKNTDRTKQDKKLSWKDYLLCWGKRANAVLRRVVGGISR